MNLELVRRQVIEDLKNLPSVKISLESVISDFIENLKPFRITKSKLKYIITFQPETFFYMILQS